MYKCTVLFLKVTVYWSVASYSLAHYLQSFGWKYCLHVQGRRNVETLWTIHMTVHSRRQYSSHSQPRESRISGIILLVGKQVAHWSATEQEDSRLETLVLGTTSWKRGRKTLTSNFTLQGPLGVTSGEVRVCLEPWEIASRAPAAMLLRIHGCILFWCHR
jgi:hypothetical protein